MKGRAEIGAYGERMAAEYYCTHGYELVCSNYRTRMGEVDLIVRSGELLVFVEVKTRAHTALAAGREAVTPAKQRRVLLAAQSYLVDYVKQECAVRFDVYEVTHENGIYCGVCIENAFGL